MIGENRLTSLAAILCRKAPPVYQSAVAKISCPMPNDIPDPDIRLLLARAFDRTWASYYRSGKLTVSRDVARTELARRLVQLSREGIRDEGKLVQAGLGYLREMTLRGNRLA